MLLNKYQKAVFSCAAAAIMIGFASLDAPKEVIVGFGGILIVLLFVVYFLGSK